MKERKIVVNVNKVQTFYADSTERTVIELRRSSIRVKETYDEVKDIRKFASKRNLETWDRPASPCLSSRLPYGTKVTVEALLMVSNSEKYLRSLGFKVVRVRHYDNKAVIEIPKDKFSFFNKKSSDISQQLKKYGYEIIELEEKGFRSGSLNIKAGIKKKTQS